MRIDLYSTGNENRSWATLEYDLSFNSIYSDIYRINIQ